MKKKLLEIYKKLYTHFGPQHWWPAESALEMVVGAILTQNTSWGNVEAAIFHLKKAKCLSFAGMKKIDEKKLARLIRPAGYYNIKSRRLKNFINFLDRRYQGSFDRMAKKDTRLLRQELLSVNGIGPETADSILLYALDKPVFVVDAYTRRICSRHRLARPDAAYDDLQNLFMRHLPADEKLFNEYHALLVKCAKEFCRKTNVRCGVCPMDRKGKA